MSFQTLNLDVVDIILSFIEPHEALSLTTTCRALHIPATRRLLYEFDSAFFYVEAAQRILRFCDYMLADRRHRPQCLRVFYLRLWSLRKMQVDPAIYVRLADVIRHATGLRKVFVTDNLDAFFSNTYLSLADAIAEVESLEHVEFDCVPRNRVALFLSRMKSRPRVLKCTMSSPIGSNVAKVVTPKPTQFLRNFTGCLTKLVLDRALELIAEIEPYTVWPHVQELVLGEWVVTDEIWRLIIRAFPNVRTLCFCEAVRSRCTPMARLGLQWSSLDLVRTSCPLPIQCHVRRVELDVILHGNNPSSINEVTDCSEMLRCASPTALTCHLYNLSLRCVADCFHSLHILRLVTISHGWRDLGADTEGGMNEKIVSVALVRPLMLIILINLVSVILRQRLRRRGSALSWSTCLGLPAIPSSSLMPS